MPAPIDHHPFHGRSLAEQQDALLQRSLSALAASPALIEALNRRRREMEASAQAAQDRSDSASADYAFRTDRAI